MIRHVVVSSGLSLFLVLGANGVWADQVRFEMMDKSLSVPVEAQNKLVGVRLDDIVASFPSLIPGLANVAANMKKSPEVFFPNGNVQVIHNAFLNKMPEVSSGVIQLSITAYVKYKEGSSFERILVTYNNGARKMSEMTVQPERSIPLKDLKFNLSVALVDRKLIIEDTMNDVKMIFPVGVGGFDEGVLNEGRVSLLTPRFQNGFIDQRAVISKREKPRYFAGKPFIRLLKGNDLKTDTTAIGFHIEINDSFVRGFDSHGCMRLRLFDLMALHDLIMDGDDQQLPIKITYRVTDPADHPAGRRNKTFKTVLNNGTAESPFFPLDRDNLVQMTYKESGAPIDQLIDDSRDNFEEVFNYDTISQMREQDERRKNECQARLMAGTIGAGPKDMEKCLDEGKRKDSLKDQLYRKLMGIDSIFNNDLF